MRATIKRFRVVAIVALLTASTVMVIGRPADAAVATYQIVNKEVQTTLGQRWCLDSNAVGDVYINPCSTTNSYQRWYIWDGGWTKNMATGLCLEGDGYFNANSIHTGTCPASQNDMRQFFRHWNGGWYQRQAYVDPYYGTLREAECISRLYGSAHDVTGVHCANPQNPPYAEVWTVYQV